MHARLASQETCDALGAFSLQFALPALVFRLIATRPLESSFNSSFYLGYPKLAAAKSDETLVTTPMADAAACLARGIA
jgi:hypothetical protein